MRDFFSEQKPLHFVFPIDGDCLNSHDGVLTENGLRITARVHAPAGSKVSINGVCAAFDGEKYTAEITLGEKETALSATDGENTDNITVYDFTGSEGKYRISSDDNILFLRDINNNRDKYSSIFENPYLAMYKRVHDMYDAKVHINLFFETGDLRCFSEGGEYFNLSMMTDKFKPEFEQNSDWLRFSFHARSEFPDKPYRLTSALRIEEDAVRVNEQIVRFAGQKTLSETTTVHWGEANRECTKALRRLGYRTLAGYFEHTDSGEPLVAYYYPDKLINYVGNRDFWKNTQDDIMHSRIDLVLNFKEFESKKHLISTLEEIKAQPHRAGFLELMIHEQYFYPQYSHYVPHFEEIVSNAAEWAFENGYRGAFLSDVIF